MSFKSLLVVSALVVLGLALPALAQPPQRGGPGGPGGARFFGGGNSGLDLLRNDDVRKELQLMDDQIEKIEGIERKLREQMQDFFQGGFQNLRDLSEEERRSRFQEIQETMRKRTEEMQKEIEGVLLPHQTKRLKQLATQRRLRGFGGSTSLMSVDQLAEVLNLSDDQKDELRKRAEQIQRELREKLIELRKDAEADLLSVLSPAQQAELKDLIGEPFEFQPPQFFGGGRGGQGGPGGAGGQGGNRRRPGGDE